MSFVQTSSLVLLTAIIICVGYPLILLVFIPIWIYRFGIERLVTKTDPKVGKLLKGFAAIFSAHTPYSKPTSVVLTLFYTETPLDRNHFIHYFNQKVMQLRDKKGNLIYRELKQRIVRKLGYNFWYDVTNFNLSNHIKYVHENEPERKVTQAEIEELTHQLTTQPFDPNESPWELIIVPNLIHDKDPLIKSVLITRFHHCLTDGVSLIQMLRRVGVNPWKDPFAIPKNNNGFITRTVIVPLRLLLEGPYQALNTLYFSNDQHQWMKKVVNEPTGTLAKQDTNFIQLSDLKRIKDQYNLSLASILVTVMVHATLQSLKRRGVHGDFSKLHITLPWPLPNHPVGVSNHWTVVKIPVLVDPTDMIKTARNVNEEFNRLKYSTQPLVFAAVSYLVGSLPSGWIPQTDSMMTSTCILSNVAGPKEAVDIDGCQVRDITVAGSTAPGYAVASLALSYNGRIRITIGGDVCNLDQKDAIYLAESCEQIVKELGNPSKTG